MECTIKGTEPRKCQLYLSFTAHKGVDNSLAFVAKHASYEALHHAPF